MTVALVLLKLTLALVFGAAGVGKLLDREGAETALADFGVPRRLVSPAAVLLPLAELAVAFALLIPLSSVWGAAGACVLLVVFSAGVANSLAHGRRPACHCFGQFGSSPASWKTLIRNAALAGAAAFVAVTNRRDAEPDAARAVQLLAVVALAALIVLVVASRRVSWLSLARLDERARSHPRLRIASRPAVRLASIIGVRPRPLGLPIGVRAPDFRLSSMNGGAVTLTALTGAGRPTVLVFSDAGCRPCVELLPTLSHWQREHRDRLTIALITSGPIEEKVATHVLENVLAQDDREVATAYEVNVTPSAVVVTPDGRIKTRLAVGELPIRALLESLTDRARDQA